MKAKLFASKLHTILAAAGLSTSLVCLGIAAAAPARADLPETILHTFTGSPDGSLPYSELTVGPDGDYYGTTEQGGAHDKGSVFKITPDGDLTVLYSFGTNSGGYTDGAYPYGPVVFGSDGTLYGTTNGGGANGLGTVYEILANGEKEDVFSFDGSYYAGGKPVAGLTYDATDSLVYGVTTGNGKKGSPSQYGSIFSFFAPVTTTGGGYATLYQFGSANGPTDGEQPQGTLTMGSLPGLYNFYPVLYGTTQTGGAGGEGTVFIFFPSYNGGTYSVVHAFSDGSVPFDGRKPSTGPVQVDAGGNIYGETSMGGGPNLGALYKIGSDFTDTILHNFTGGNDGQTPEGGLLLTSPNSLFGTTSFGGSSGYGVLFGTTTDGDKGAPNNDGINVAYGFGDDNSGDGLVPMARPFADGDGNLVGTTSDSFGTSSDGTIYKISEAGVPLPSVSLDIAAPTVTGGSEKTYCTLTLDAPAPSGGATIDLGSSDAVTAPVPASVFIPAGQTIAIFYFKTPAVSSSKNVTVTATYGNKAAKAALTVTPQPAVPLIAGVFQSGAPTVFGTLETPDYEIYLTGNATADTSIPVTSSNPIVVNPVTPVHVTQGYTGGFLFYKTTQVLKPTTVTLTATLNGVSKSTTVTVLPTPVYLQTVTLAQNIVTGGTTLSGSRVHLSNRALSDTRVFLTSSNPAVASVPAYTLVHLGYTSYVFDVTTKPVSKSTDVTITATSGGVTTSKTLIVNP